MRLNRGKFRMPIKTQRRFDIGRRPAIAQRVRAWRCWDGQCSRIPSADSEDSRSWHLADRLSDRGRERPLHVPRNGVRFPVVQPPACRDDRESRPDKGMFHFTAPFP